MIAYVNNQISCKSKGDVIANWKKKKDQINWSMARKCKKKCKCIP